MIEVQEITKSSLAENPVIAQMAVNNHEQVVFCNDNETGLKAIIAIHNTVLGPSLGGTRMWPYKNEMEALTDVLRLSRGMTYKSSLAGLNLGGGKAVIIGDSTKIKSETLLRRFGKFINNLSGKYITAEDMGVNTQDMEHIKKETNFVSGLPESMGGSGDPSPVTAHGVYLGMKASAKEKWGNDSLAGKKVVVQGVGHVGESLVGALLKEGAIVSMYDLHQDRLERISKETGAIIITEPSKIYDLEMDIYAPCAFGAVINTDTLSRLKCSIICGAANNQLADENVHGKMVMDKGILYAPDFVVNAGGIINVYYELEGYNRAKALAHAEKIYDTTLNIYKISKEQNIPTYAAANHIAEQRIADKLKESGNNFQLITLQNNAE
jgi:leucine dehydrogenase